MKTIVIGYSDSGTPKVLLGLDEPEQKKAQLMHEAKRLHSFPKGIVKVEQCTLQVCETAIFLGAETAKAASAAEAERKKHEDAVAAAREEKLKHASNVKDAEAHLRGVAVKRNEAVSKLASLKTQRDQHRDAGRSGEAEKMTDDIAKAQSTADTLVEKFKATLAIVEVVKNPKSDKEAVANALEALKSQEEKPEKKK